MASWEAQNRTVFSIELSIAVTGSALWAESRTATRLGFRVPYTRTHHMAV
ncbi:MAG: hypothetical protein ABJB93_02905 [Gaiellales bacterium]